MTTTRLKAFFPQPAPNSIDSQLEDSIACATKALCALQRPDGHFVFELEADATIPAEYVLMRHYRGEPINAPLEAKIARYLRRIQSAEGGWPLFHAGASDVSASVKAYFALKMIGERIDAPHMVRARNWILARGGAAYSNVFTRNLLALYGDVPWRAVPVMPVEIMLLPRWFPFHLDKVSYWARTVLVPLMVLNAIKPRARNPRGVGIAELFTTPPEDVQHWPKGAHQTWPWAQVFGGIDRILRVVEPYSPRTVRRRAIDRAVKFVIERLNEEDGLGAIFPAMVNSLLMFDALGYADSHINVRTARASIEKLLMVREDEAYCQPCLSPVWDTALAAHTLLEVGGPDGEGRALSCLEWLRPLQVLDTVGDWASARPGLRPGGWAFQYANPHYPDLDDTAAVALALDRFDGQRYAAATERAAEWVVGMQSKNGGWGSFDADNTHYYLNHIPFADHGALLDPPTADVSARCVGFLAQRGYGAEHPAIAAGLDYLRREQEPEGCWFGRWGTNYVYGTWSVLVALNAIGVPKHDPMVRRAPPWLKSKQRPDGGWGEDCQSYW